MTASTIMWPASGLEIFTINMAGSTFNERFDMPEEWRAAILTNRYHSGGSGLSDKTGGDGGYSGNGGGGGGGGGARGDPGGGNRWDRWQDHGGGGDRRDGQDGGHGRKSDHVNSGDPGNSKYKDDNDNTGAWKRAHPDRYTNPVNPHVCPQIKAVLQPLVDASEKIKPFVLCRLAGSTLSAVVLAAGFRGEQENEDIICPTYAVGRCNTEDCKRAHLFCSECPSGYAKNFAKVVGPGVQKYLAGDRLR